MSLVSLRFFLPLLLLTCPCQLCFCFLGWIFRRSILSWSCSPLFLIFIYFPTGYFIWISDSTLPLSPQTIPFSVFPHFHICVPQCEALKQSLTTSHCPLLTRSVDFSFPLPEVWGASFLAPCGVTEENHLLCLLPHLRHLPISLPQFCKAKSEFLHAWARLITRLLIFSPIDYVSPPHTQHLTVFPYSSVLPVTTSLFSSMYMIVYNVYSISSSQILT